LALFFDERLGAETFPLAIMAILNEALFSGKAIDYGEEDDSRFNVRCRDSGWAGRDDSNHFCGCSTWVA
jgi:hypothetical protein